MSRKVIYSLTFFFTLLSGLQANVFQDNSIVANERGYLFEIHGSNTIGATLAPNMVSRWFEQHSFTDIAIQALPVENEAEVVARSPSGRNVKVFVAAHGSGTGFVKIKEGEGDIAATSRPAKASENSLFPTIDVTAFDSETVLAIDGLAIVVHPLVPIEALSVEQVGALFSGQVSNWSQLGGPNLAVRVHARDDRSGTYDTFAGLVLSRGFELVDNAQRYESNDVLAATVARTPGSIGFTAISSVGDAKLLAIRDGEGEAMLPTPATIGTEDYPLSRRLYMYQVNLQNPFAKDFLSFAKTEVAQKVVEEVGFISQNLRTIDWSVPGELPQGYRFMTERSQRVTTNFRFKPGTKELDNKALDDLQRLAKLMSQPENEGRTVILVGFSDKQRDEFKAQLLSESRVMSVRRLLREVNVESSAMTGYGELNPVASNADSQYALRNQRVEVWIR